MAVTFLCCIAPLQSAIQVAGDAGARVKLDIPDTEMDAVVVLMAMRGETLVVTVQTEAEWQENGRVQVDTTAREGSLVARPGPHSQGSIE